MTLEDLKKHSDKRDDVIEEKLNNIDDFLHNGLMDKIIKGITDYLDQQTARRVRMFFKIFFTAVTIAGVGALVKLLVF